MTYAVIALAVLLLLAVGGLLFGLALLRYLTVTVLAGRPLLVTLPGNRPGTSVTYAVTKRGWKRVTEKITDDVVKRGGVFSVAKEAMNR